MVDKKTIEEVRMLRERDEANTTGGTMTEKEVKIAKILTDALTDVYCQTCSGWTDKPTRENQCEDCYRKMMHWSLSDECAMRLAQEITNI